MDILENGPDGRPAARPEPKISPGLKLLLELGPLVVFFLANSRGEWLAAKFPGLAALGGPIFVATAIFIVATFASLVAFFALTRKLPVMPLVTAVVVLVFGGLTLWLRDETFIKVKATIVYCLFGATLLIGLAFGKSLLGYVFDSVFRLTEAGWRRLTFRWGLFFFALAAVNEVVWRSFSTDTWVAFKAFGFLPLTVAFTLAQMPLIQRYSLPEAD